MMSARAAQLCSGAVGCFGKCVLRPPVPGEETVKRETVRPENYEPEGRALSDHAHPSWAESLGAVLDDQDGISLFRDFLAQDAGTDLIDFWLACRGFQLAFCTPASCLPTSPDVLNKRRLKLTKAIYRKYIVSSGVVAKTVSAMTKSSIGERVHHARLDSTLFLHAKQEVQDAMEQEVFPVFLKSSVFLTYCSEQENHTRELNTYKQKAGNNQQKVNNSIQEAGGGKKELEQKTENDRQEVVRFLPALVEKREWVESEKVSINQKRPEHREAGYKMKHRLIQGCVKADAHKTSRRHKDDVPAEPHKFAADLISRLELVQRERENWRRLEEHLHPVSTQETDEHVDTEVSTASSLCPAHLVLTLGSSYSMVQWCDTHTENPELILDQHASTTHTLAHTCCKIGEPWHYRHVTGTNQNAALVYSSRRKCVCESVAVAYYFCGEPIPFRTTIKGRVVTLAHFTQLLSHRGAYRYFFMKASDEFDGGVVYEEVCEDEAVLPVFQGKIIGKVEKIC